MNISPNNDSKINDKTEKRASLSCMYLNARSLTNKTSLLSNYAQSYKPDIIAITETWANSDTPDGFYHIPGYNLFRSDRIDRRGGGVMIFILNSVLSSEVSLLRSHEFESICIKVKLKRGTYLGLLCVYRPPNITSTGDLLLIKLFESFININCNKNVIIGDFNMPSINWNTLSAPPKYDPFLDCLSNSFLKQNVHDSTRPNSHALLDLIFTTTGTNIYDISVDECFGSSDHCIITFNIQITSYLVNSNQNTLKRNYSKADWILFRKILLQVDWNSIFYENDINKIWQSFKNVITKSMDISIPYKKRQSWQIKSNPKIRSALRYTRRCNSDYKTFRTKETLLKFIHAKLYLQELIDKQTSIREKIIIKSLSDNPKYYWSYVNSKLNKKQNSQYTLKTGDRIVDDPNEVSETLNEFFFKSFNSEGKDIPSLNMESQSDIKISDVDINLANVRSVIKYLPNKCSEDHNGISYTVIKGGGEVLALQLTRLFCLSFKIGQLPRDWKKSVIIPIKKKVTTNTMESFRPINITSSICRVLERIIRNSLSMFLIENCLINRSQHGFLYSRSTTSALLSYTNDLTYALDKGMCTDSAYFDFSKAFDSVRHDYLIEKLLKVGISGNLIRWIIDYLTNRTQVVKINNSFSSEKQVMSGVIQGSVLGPTFFTIFINDVDDHIKHSTVLKYADDIRLYHSCNSDSKSQTEHSALFQLDIDALASWSSLWNLKFNPLKCCVLHFGRSNMKAQYKINNLDLIKKNQEKDLGIVISDKFKFDTHIDSIVKKANKQLGIITKIFKSKSPSIIIPLYKTFVRPHLEYNSTIWSPYTKKNIKKIEKVQKRMCNIIYGARSMSYSQKLKKSNLLSLQVRRIKDQIINVYKIKHNLMDLDFDEFFSKNKYEKTRGNAFRLTFQKSKSKIRHHFFSCSVVKHWNKLKSNEINVRSLKMFKRNVLNYLRREHL